jgi:hypothetical protein
MCFSRLRRLACSSNEAEEQRKRRRRIDCVGGIEGDGGQFRARFPSTVAIAIDHVLLLLLQRFT